MPNPKKYKNKKKFLHDCLHQTLQVEKKDRDQGLAQCFNMWRERNKKADRVVSAFRYRQAHDFSSIQCQMPWDLAGEIIAWGKENIADSELSGDGREDDIHVTLKYGLHQHDPYELRLLLSRINPIEITLGEISVFENGDIDVVKLGVQSPALCIVNGIISECFENTNTHPDYIPHITVAYVRHGLGKKYAGNKTFAGRKLKLNSAIFSGNDNRKTELFFKIPL
jgi:2'-5' RNA ligase